MILSELTAVSPVDGRYRKTAASLAVYFSEYALIRYRVRVEIEYFIALSKVGLPQLHAVSDMTAERLRELYRNFSESDAEEVKETEKTTNHDVKSVEYFIKKHFDPLGLSEYKEFVHFGLTSQDINNTAVPLSIKEAMTDLVVPSINALSEKLAELASTWNDVPMLSRTHGQPASPTRLGKEIRVFVERLQGQLDLLNQIPFKAKFGGATGNFNAHHAAFPQTDWILFADSFVTNYLQLSRSRYTTQIEHYDCLAALFDNVKRINTIILDLNRDMWHYISLDYFKQRITPGEVGSSAMPHKVNPIDFENSEGNLGIANAVFEHLSAKLPVSRLQRDLTDSTVLRNVGVPFAHTLIAINATIKGLDKLVLNQATIDKDLHNNPAVIAEAIQTVLRSIGYPNPYETLKELTRTNENITLTSIHAFIDSLDTGTETKQRLKAFTPHNYTGVLPTTL